MDVRSPIFRKFRNYFNCQYNRVGICFVQLDQKFCLISDIPLLAFVTPVDQAIQRRRPSDTKINVFSDFSVISKIGYKKRRIKKTKGIELRRDCLVISDRSTSTGHSPGGAGRDGTLPVHNAMGRK